MADVAEHPAIKARRIATTIAAARINLTSEATAHRSILAALVKAGVEHESEVRLSASDRIDVMCGRVGVEIKVGHQRRSIWKQLKRYAASDQVDALVLATGTAWPAGVRDVDGVPLAVADLSRGWL